MEKMRAWQRSKPEIGEFIEIPSWKTFGMVIGIQPPMYGSDDAIRVLIEEYPGQRIGDCKWFHLEPGQYTLEG
jgi:hypothetical protein